MLILFEELPGKKIMRGQRQPEDILGGLRWPETARGYPRRVAVARDSPRISSQGCGGQRQREDILGGLRWPETARGYPRRAAVARNSPAALNFSPKASQSGKANQLFVDLFSLTAIPRRMHRISFDLRS